MHVSRLLGYLRPRLPGQDECACAGRGPPAAVRVC
jgi:hypothetical protein